MHGVSEPPWVSNGAREGTVLGLPIVRDCTEDVSPKSVPSRSIIADAKSLLEKSNHKSLARKLENINFSDVPVSESERHPVTSVLESLTAMRENEKFSFSTV